MTSNGQVLQYLQPGQLGAPIDGDLTNQISETRKLYNQINRKEQHSNHDCITKSGLI